MVKQIFFRLDINAVDVPSQVEQADRNIQPIREDGGLASFDVAAC
jgi:hypothetical protein